MTRTTRLRQIEAQMVTTPVQKRQLGRDAELVARNLFRILVDAETPRASRKHLAARALKIDQNQAQKKLDELTLSDRVSDASLPGRRGRLQKKPNNYCKIAEECASAMRLEREEVLLRLFDGTTYGSGRPIDEDDHDSHELITNLLRGIARKLIDAEDLTTFWTRLIETNGRFDPRFQRILPAKQPIVIEFGGLSGNAICVDEMSPIASASLLRRRQQVPITGEIWIAPQPEPLDFHPAECLGMPYLTPVGFETDDTGQSIPILPCSQDGSQVEGWDIGNFDRLNVQFIHWLQVRLAIGPQASCREPISSDVGPLLELRTVLEAEHGDETIVLDNPFHDGFAVVRWVKRAERWYRAVIGSFDGVPPPSFSNDWFNMPGHHYFAWGELSVASLESVLAEDLFPDAGYEWIAVADGAPLLSVEPRWQAVEQRALGSLADELINSAAGYRALLRDHRRDLHHAFEDQARVVLRRIDETTAKFTNRRHEDFE